MKYLKLFLLFLIIVAAACKKPKVEIPPEVIPPDSMVQVLTDIHIAEAAIGQKSSTGDNGDLFAASYFKFVFDKYKITELQYRNSTKFYAAHPDLYENIYSIVISEISKRQADALQKK